MRQKVLASLLLVLLLSMIGGLSIASAQTSGAIRGTVYKDLDANGVCVATGEPVQADIAIEFVSDDGTSYFDYD